MQVVNIIYPMRFSGGAAGVVVWALQALRKKYKLKLVTFCDWPVDAINSYYGTELSQSDFEVIKPGGDGVGRLIEKLPVPLVMSLMCLYVKLRIKEGVCFSCYGEFDFGRPGIQYIHFPFFSDGRISTYEEAAIGYKDSLVKRAFRRACEVLCQKSLGNIKKNLTLCNSMYTAGVTRKVYGITPTVLYPPVFMDDFSPPAWADKKDKMIMLGRICSYKRQHAGIEAVEKIRAMGKNVELDIVGSFSVEDEYYKKIKALADARPWVRLHSNVSRTELVRLVSQCRYGIHGMEKEHFGIAVVEMVAAGCIPFVPNVGGQVEIVSPERERLTYPSGDIDQLVSNVMNLMNDPCLAERIQKKLMDSMHIYSEKVFMHRVVDLVDTYGR